MTLADISGIASMFSVSPVCSVLSVAKFFLTKF